MEIFSEFSEAFQLAVREFRKSTKYWGKTNFVQTGQKENF